MKEQTCKDCKYSGYDRSSRTGWCCNDLSENFEGEIEKEQAACEEFEEGK